MPKVRQGRGRLVPFVFIPALTLLLLICFTPEGGPPNRIRAQEEEPYFSSDSVAVMSERRVCSLLSDSKLEVGIRGQDHGGVAVLNGTAYWSFGDTVLASGLLLPNIIGQSSDFDASDCINLEPKQENGQPVPLLPKVSGELTVWPVALEPTADDLIHFYYFSVVPHAVEGWSVQGIGIGSFDTKTLEGSRALDGALVWQADDPWPVSTFTDGDYVYVELSRASQSGTDTLLGRVRPEDIEAPTQYEYWQPDPSGPGGTWLSDMWDAQERQWLPGLDNLGALWHQPGFHNGAEVAYNQFLGRWTAVYTTGLFTHVGIRAAGQLTGPWGPESLIIDCGAYHPDQDAGFVCYSGAQVDSYSTDGGRTMYVTYSSGEDYEVYLHEVRLASPVLEDRNAQGQTEYTRVSPSPEPSGDIAFYASDVPAPLLSPIHQWRHTSTGEVRYSTSAASPDYLDEGVAFFAPPDDTSAAATNLPQAPVRRWTSGGDTRYSPFDLSVLGYDAHEVAFFSPCPDRDEDGLSDCEESFGGTSMSSADTDGDGLQDGFEVSADGCDPLSHNAPDGDGIGLTEELTQGLSPCQWDSGAWGCVNGEVRIPECDMDTDGDGCADAWELGPQSAWGGQRDPEYTWDFYDVPDDGGERDGAIVSIQEVFTLARRLGANDASGAAWPNRGSDLESPVPPPPGYHPAFDRSNAPQEPGQIRLGPPDGMITIIDILGLARQFGTTCREEAIPKEAA